MNLWTIFVSGLFAGGASCAAVQGAGRSPGWWMSNGLAGPSPVDPGAGVGADGALAYYADSVEGPGRWLDRGLAGFGR